MVRVDDWRHGENGPVAVIDDGVNGRVTNDVQVAAQMLVLLVKLHHLFASHLLGLVQRGKLDLIRWQSLVGKRTLDGVQIVGSNGDEGTLSCKVLVQLVLKSNERLISGLGELDVPQDGAGEVGAYLGSLQEELVNCLREWEDDIPLA